ncbi:CPBP family intramembrane glutamic endopeptidase [Nonomuraea sp. NPDC059194]|uniref:CPBP family intramembrane glutamic endopeptidase n=1 Tax=Nonomuraea sp. NPDC059194 TaxID=3346764 RepID=UPI003674318B
MSVVLFALLVIHLAVVSPLLGRRTYTALRENRSLYTRMNLAWIAELWAIALVALAIVGLSPDLDVTGIGLVPAEDLSTVLGMVVGAAVVAVGVGLVLRFKKVTMPGQAAFEALIPRTASERWLALGLAISAGVCEEIVYRGVLISGFMSILDVPRPVAAGLALAVFVLGHLYQGWRGMTMVGLAGFSLTMLYFSTGSLILPIILHILVDVRSLLVTPWLAPGADKPETRTSPDSLEYGEAGAAADVTEPAPTAARA